jgi:hypothetical protein
VFDDFLFAFPGDDSDDASIAEVVEFSSAVWIETAVDHGAFCPLNSIGCIRGFEGRLDGDGMQVWLPFANCRVWECVCTGGVKASTQVLCGFCR